MPVAPPRPLNQVYEDIFPIGAVPPDLCPLHGASMVRRAGNVADGCSDAPATPMVDAALQQSSGSAVMPIGTSGSPATVRSANPRIYYEPVVGSDGVVRMVKRQRVGVRS